MSHNIEIKARYGDLREGKRIAERIGASFSRVDRQVDTYFQVPRGRLKIRESSSGEGQLIPYLRPDRSGPKDCEYAVIPLEDARAAVGLLAGILGVSNVVKKTRTIYLLDNVRIHLDEVEDLGTFLEFEAVCKTGDDEEISRNRECLRELLREFRVKEEDLLEGSYHELLKECDSSTE